MLDSLVKVPGSHRYLSGRVSSFNQSEAEKHYFLASDRLKFETLPQKYCFYSLFLAGPDHNRGAIKGTCQVADSHQTEGFKSRMILIINERYL